MANYFGVFERYSELSGCLSISERVSVMFSSTAQASDRLERMLGKLWLNNTRIGSDVKIGRSLFFVGHS